MMFWRIAGFPLRLVLLLTFGTVILIAYVAGAMTGNLDPDDVKKLLNLGWSFLLLKDKSWTSEE